MAKNINFVSDAYRTICNYGGIEIMISNDGDGVIYSYFGKIAKRWQEIKYTTTGRAYFTIQGKREYLENYTRIN